VLNEQTGFTVPRNAGCAENAEKKKEKADFSAVSADSAVNNSGTRQAHQALSLPTAGRFLLVSD
jgi:hypothetical protein